MKSSLKDRLISIADHLEPIFQGNVRKDLHLLFENGIEKASDLMACIKNKHAKKDLRLIACWAIGHLSIKKSIDALLIAFNGDDMDLTWEAAKSLGTIGNKRTVTSLIKIMLESNDVGKRTAAAYSLGIIADRRAVKPLINIVTDLSEDNELRAHAAESLGYLGDVQAVDSLIQGLRDKLPEIRYWSAFALGLIGDERALPELRKVVENDEAVLGDRESVRNEAKHAMESILSKHR